MKVSGFTFVRNAIRYDYPVVESIRSILPLCDEFVVAVGNSDDKTRELIDGIGDPKIKIIDTVWDDTLRKGGRVLAVETDKAFAAVSPDSVWAFYLQADEVVHEKDLVTIREAMERYEHDDRVDGLLFRYLHFYGSYDYFGNSRDWYRHEIRVVRNLQSVHSWLDAQGFRKDGQKLNVVPVDAAIYHYGWVKPPARQQAKQQNFHRYWHGDTWMDKNISGKEEFDYANIDSLAQFTDTHPAVMAERISMKNWTFDFDPACRKSGIFHLLLHYFENLTGWRPGEYRNFRIVK
ncbi:MAG: hypothetical protein PHP04_07065 [Bacteroidales bacterium]|nr:hypothetical protein [Bacteroidales bacterium]